MSPLIIHLITLQEISQWSDMLFQWVQCLNPNRRYFRLWNDTRESSILTVGIFDVILLNLLDVKTKRHQALALSLLANNNFFHLNCVIFCLCSWKMLMSVWGGVLNVFIFQILHNWHMVRRWTMSTSLSIYFWFSWALRMWFLSRAGSPLQRWTHHCHGDLAWH